MWEIPLIQGYSHNANGCLFRHEFRLRSVRFLDYTTNDASGCGNGAYSTGPIVLESVVWTSEDCFGIPAFPRGSFRSKLSGPFNNLWSMGEIGSSRQWGYQGTSRSVVSFLRNLTTNLLPHQASNGHLLSRLQGQLRDRGRSLPSRARTYPLGFALRWR